MITYQLEKMNKQTSNMAASIYFFLAIFVACLMQWSAVKKFILGLPRLEDFGFSIDVAHFSSAEIVRYMMIFVYLLVCGNI